MEDYTDTAGISTNVNYYSDKADEEGIEILCEGELRVDYVVDDYGVEAALNAQFYTEDSREYNISEVIIDDKKGKNIIYKDAYVEMIKADSNRNDMEKETDIRLLEKNGFDLGQLTEGEISNIESIIDTALDMEISELIDDINPEDGPFEFDDVELETTTLTLAAIVREKVSLNLKKLQLEKNMIKNLGLTMTKRGTRKELPILNSTTVSEFMNNIKEKYPESFQDMINNLKENGGSKEIEKYLEDKKEIKINLEKIELKRKNVIKLIREDIANRKAANAAKKPQ